MIPLALAPNCACLALAGAGAPALRRLRALRAAGAEGILVYAPAANSALAAEASDGCFIPHLPDAAALSTIQLLWITGLAPEAGAALAAAARAARVLVNVEDVPELCDFHAVAELRRGDLLLTISTNGAAPGLAGAIRRRLEAFFPPVWAERVREIAALRQGWRAEGISMPEAARRIDDIVEERCWLSCPTRP